MYGNNQEKTIQDIEKEKSYLKGELANTYQQISNLRNKNLTCFLQGVLFHGNRGQQRNPVKTKILLLTSHRSALL